MDRESLLWQSQEAFTGEEPYAPEVMEHIQAIRRRTMETWEAILDIGYRLRELKGLVPHGIFQTIYEKQLGLTKSSASRFMRAFKVFGGRRISYGGNFSPSAIYQLSQANVPETLRLQAIEASQRGEMVNADWVRKRMRKKNPPDEAIAQTKALSGVLQWVRREHQVLQQAVCEEVLICASEIVALLSSSGLRTHAGEVGLGEQPKKHDIKLLDGINPVVQEMSD